MSVNTVAISGNLGRTPELKSTQSGMQTLRLSVCVNSRVKRDGEWVDKPNWVQVTFFGNRAESLSRYLEKGMHVTVSGHLSQSRWKTKDGQDRSMLEVIGEDIDFSGGSAKRTDDTPADPQPDMYDEDIPF